MRGIETVVAKDITPFINGDGGTLFVGTTHTTGTGDDPGSVWC